jgi:hypothetical protein
MLVFIFYKAFFTHRAYVLSSKVWVAAPAFTIELFNSGVVLAGAAISWKVGNIIDFRVHASFVFYMAFIAAATVCRSPSIVIVRVHQNHH